MVKMKFNIVDKQAAFEYVLYMMLGSYFDKVACCSPMYEKKMHMQYQQQKEESQIQMEDFCIRFVEKELMPQLPEDFWKQQMEVRFLPTNVKGMREVQFIGADYALRVSGIFLGQKNTNMHYEAWGIGNCLMAA